MMTRINEEAGAVGSGRDPVVATSICRPQSDPTSALALPDFGLCCPASPQALRDMVSARLYTAPEVFSGDYSAMVDARSAGVMLFVMLPGEFPVDNTTVGPAGRL